MNRPRRRSRPAALIADASASGQFNRAYIARRLLLIFAFTGSYQVRVYLGEDLAEAAYRGDQSALQPLMSILSRQNATLTSQFRAFEDYVLEAEREGVEKYALHKWTKAMRAKHIGAFAIRVGGAEVYAKDVADRIENDLQPLVGGGLVSRMSKHDTDPAKNIPVPWEFRP